MCAEPSGFVFTDGSKHLFVGDGYLLNGDSGAFALYISEPTDVQPPRNEPRCRVPCSLKKFQEILVTPFCDVLQTVVVSRQVSCPPMVDRATQLSLTW